MICVDKDYLVKDFERFSRTKFLGFYRENPSTGRFNTIKEDLIH